MYEGRVLIPVTGLPHCCVCPKPGPIFTAVLSLSLVFGIYSSNHVKQKTKNLSQ